MVFQLCQICKYFFKFRNRNRKCRVIVLLSILVVLFNEWLLFELCHFKWKWNADVSLNTDKNVHNILLVADPQLIGFEYENKFLGPIVRWDADRFLMAGFYRALKHSNPHAVVFLGDLTDEGEIASDKQFNTYCSRFKSIFEDQIGGGTKMIVIPGDNDVGGEYSKLRDKQKVQRFQKKFDHEYPYVDSLGKINFVAADIHSIDDLKQTMQFTRLDQKKSSFNVLLNHKPMPTDLNIFKLQNNIHLIISAHTHLSNYKYCNHCNEGLKVWSNSIKLESHENLLFHLPPISSKIMEISVPTCSYRMGVPYPGYGYLQITEDGTVSYRVLWLPYRFYCLEFYCAYLIVIFILICLT